MATNKSYEDKIRNQQEIMERAARQIRELKEAARKDEEERKQKKIESILKDVEKALSNSPILEYKKNSEEYKRILDVIRNGVDMEQYRLSFSADKDTEETEAEG